MEVWRRGGGRSSLMNSQWINLTAGDGSFLWGLIACPGSGGTHSDFTVSLFLVGIFRIWYWSLHLLRCWLQKKIFGPLTWAAKSPLASRGTRFAVWPAWFGGSVMDCAAEFVTHLSVYPIWDPVDFLNIVTERHSNLRSTSIRGSSMPAPFPLVGRCQGVSKRFTNVENPEELWVLEQLRRWSPK